MIELIIGTDTDLRAKKRSSILHNAIDVVVLDDMTGSVARLEHYAYPSLFSIGAPVVHAKFLLETSSSELTKELLKTLIGSPTLFILEEHAVIAATVKLIEKEGGIIHQATPIKQVAKPNTIFGVTNAITASSKKERWLAYQKASTEHAPEALIGVLYWKLRQLIETPTEKNSAKNTQYKELYRALMHAQKEAWQKGFPLSLAIEKVLIQQ